MDAASSKAGPAESCACPSKAGHSGALFSLRFISAAHSLSFPVAHGAGTSFKSRRAFKRHHFQKVGETPRVLVGMLQSA